MSISGIPFITLTEAAEEIGLTTGRLRQLLRAGKIKGHKFGPRAWVISEKEVKRLKKEPQTTGRPRVGKK